jgi:nucleotide-binding universal stress UspA family protein
MYANIIVPVDGSGTSIKGLLEAMKIAAKLGSSICLVHVVNEFIFDYSYSPAGYAANVVDVLRERGKAVLADAVALARAKGQEPATVLIESIGGPAADAIVGQAVERHADLIVMGTHGRRGLRRLALGSDAEQVVRLSRVPVLLVRDEAASGADEARTVSAQAAA